LLHHRRLPRRARRVVEVASEKGLAGVLVTPGPNLVLLTGSHPTAITERLAPADLGKVHAVVGVDRSLDGWQSSYSEVAYTSVLATMGVALVRTPFGLGDALSSSMSERPRVPGVVGLQTRLALKARYRRNHP
jgi:hypothetical protein